MAVWVGRLREELITAWWMSRRSSFLHEFLDILFFTWLAIRMDRIASLPDGRWVERGRKEFHCWADG